MAFPSAADLRTFLQGYGLDTESKFTVTGTTVHSSAIVTGLDTTRLAVGMYVSGIGIQPSSQIESVDVVDPVAGQITMDVITAAGGTTALTFTYFDTISTGWFDDVLAHEVQPFIERMTRQTFDRVEQVTEYYDGTGSSILALRRRPIVSLVSLSYTNVDSNLYYLSPSAMVIIKDEAILKAKANFNESSYTPIFWKGQRNLRVIYNVGWADCPADVAQAVKYLMGEVALGHVADQTGGGNLNVQGYSRDYGKRGRYTNIRNSLARRAYVLLQQYVTGIGQ